MTYQEATAARDTLAGAAEALRSLAASLPFVQGDEIGEVVAQLAQVAAATRGALASVAVEAQARGVVAESGCRGTVAWLQHCAPGIKDSEAAALHRAITATGRRGNAPLREALCSGEATPSDAICAAETVDELRRATDAALHDAFAEGVAELSRAQASRAVLREYRTEMLARFGTEQSLDELHAHQQARRGVTAMRPVAGGMWRFEATLTPAEKAAVDATLTALSAPRRDAVSGAADERSPAQRRADALVSVFTKVAGHGQAGPLGASTRVTLILPVEALHAPCPHRTCDIFGIPHPGQEPCDCPEPVAAHDDLGTALLPGDTRRLSCGADVSRLYVGAQGEPLALGRTERCATPGQRKALAARDGGCTFPGCEAPSSWTQAHHLVHWADGGGTDLDNLALLCQRHHTYVHQQHIDGHVGPDRTVHWHTSWAGGHWAPDPGPCDQLSPPAPDDRAA
ncbi:HNH endonuclease signature motif containing protein [Arsenicicoccus sp. oral taxon 190]|uniref:HNH endonuclease signature motif containing protein n=1 Tax=Arsenicicoccus sp. oral taxon 190 TaxID=1658671 RepID=UPI00067BEE49|nr:HNH endonuclease signature motif containing protein [Arsenicicoccus sp. oral taxon 190]